MGFVYSTNIFGANVAANETDTDPLSGAWPFSLLFPEPPKKKKKTHQVLTTAALSQGCSSLWGHPAMSVNFWLSPRRGCYWPLAGTGVGVADPPTSPGGAPWRGAPQPHAAHVACPENSQTTGRSDLAAAPRLLESTSRQVTCSSSVSLGRPQSEGRGTGHTAGALSGPVFSGWGSGTVLGTQVDAVWIPGPSLRGHGQSPGLLHCNHGAPHNSPRPLSGLIWEDTALTRQPHGTADCFQSPAPCRSLCVAPRMPRLKCLSSFGTL